MVVQDELPRILDVIGAPRAEYCGGKREVISTNVVLSLLLTEYR